MSHRFQYTAAADLLARNGEQSRLHAEANELTRQTFGTSVFVRGVIELSNFCRENCHYCGMRRSNRKLERFRAGLDELSDLVLNQVPAGVTDINLQAGEDPRAVREIALPLIRLIRAETKLGISVCLGTLDYGLYDELREAGASIYILKFEVADVATYRRLESPGTSAERFAHISWLAANGWSVSSGFICGLPGDEPRDIFSSLQCATELPIRGCSVSPFVAGEETPLQDEPTADVETVLNCIALMRKARPEWIIPAVSALNICQPEIGYRRALRAGANLVTMNLTPQKLRGNYLLYKRDRHIMNGERIYRALEAEGLQPSPIGLAQYWQADTALRPERVSF